MISMDTPVGEGAGSPDQQDGGSIGDSDEDSLGMFTPSDVDFGSEGNFAVHGLNVQMPRAGRKRAKYRSRDNISCVSSRDSKTRARARKPHEPSPFLSIDNLPLEKTNSFAQEMGVQGGGVEVGMNASHLSRDARLATLIAATGPAGVSRPGSRPVSQVGSAVSSEWNSIVPRHNRNVGPSSGKKKPTPGNNSHIQSPFKHATYKKVPAAKRPVSPGELMREQTLIATSCVARTLAKSKTPQEKKVVGRLLKGKLKPLYPVNVEGPSIEQCRGIVSEPKVDTSLSYPSNTVYRRQMALHDHLSKIAMLERPPTVESIHRTSIASDLSETRDLDLKPEWEELTSEARHLDGSVDEEHVTEPCPVTMMAEMSDSGVGVGNTYITETSESYHQLGPAAPPTSPMPQSCLTATTAPDQQASSTDAAPVSTAEEILIEATTTSPVPRKTAARPKTTMDPSHRKAVRFADDTSVEVNDRRAKSASGRLAQKNNNKQNKENKSNSKNGASSCRPSTNDVNWKNKDDGDDDPEDGGKRDSACRRGGGDGGLNAVSAARSGSTGTQSKSTHTSNGKEPSTSQTDGVSLNQSQDLQLSYNNVRFAENSSSQNDNRMRVSRPRSRLGCWEDPVKPSRTDSMSVVGHNWEQDAQFAVKPKSNIKMSQSKSRIISKEMRPQSEKEVTRFSVEKVRAYHRQRPASAQVKVHDSFNPSLYMDSDLIIRPDASVDTTEPADKITGHFNGNTKNKRPVSGISIATAATRQESIAVAEPCYDDASKNFGVVGNRMEQVIKAGVCIQCCKPTSKIAIYSENMGVLICDICDQQNKAKIKKIKALAAAYRARKMGKVSDYAGIEDDEGDGMELVPDEIVTDDVHELGRMLDDLEQSRQSKLNQHVPASSESEVQDNGGSDKLFTQMDQLEESLAAVQEEIRHCMQEVKDACQTKPLTSTEMSLSLSETSLEVFSQTELDVDKTELPKAEEEPDVEDFGGEISKHLTHDMPTDKKPGSYQMKVYHFWQGAKKGKSWTGTAAEEKTMEVANVVEDDPDITTYDVTMLQELSNEYGIITPEVTSSETLVAPSSESSVYLQDHQSIAAECEDSFKSKEQEMDPVLADLEKDLGGLEIVAEAKTLNKSKLNTVQVSSKPFAPVAPLCFKVNARPPDGFLYYFAYGADMNPNRMETYLQRPVKQRNWGLLFGFRLTFNKRGLDEEAGCFPNIQHNVTSSIEGCLYQITQKELKRLDSHVGYPQHFEHVMLPVWMLNCSDPDNYGVAQYCVPALMYISHDAWTVTGEKLSNQYSLTQCMQGGDLLTNGYQERLQQQARVMDQQAP